MVRNDLNAGTPQANLAMYNNAAKNGQALGKAKIPHESAAASIRALANLLNQKDGSKSAKLSNMAPNLMGEGAESHSTPNILLQSVKQNLKLQNEDLHFLIAAFVAGRASSSGAAEFAGRFAARYLRSTRKEEEEKEINQEFKFVRDTEQQVKQVASTSGCS